MVVNHHFEWWLMVDNDFLRYMGSAKWQYDMQLILGVILHAIVDVQLFNAFDLWFSLSETY